MVLDLLCGLCYKCYFCEGENGRNRKLSVNIRPKPCKPVACKINSHRHVLLACCKRKAATLKLHCKLALYIPWCRVLTVGLEISSWQTLVQISLLWRSKANLCVEVIQEYIYIMKLCYITINTTT